MLIKLVFLILLFCGVAVGAEDQPIIVRSLTGNEIEKYMLIVKQEIDWQAHSGFHLRRNDLDKGSFIIILNYLNVRTLQNAQAILGYHSGVLVGFRWREGGYNKRLCGGGYV